MIERVQTREEHKSANQNLSYCAKTKLKKKMAGQNDRASIAKHSKHHGQT